MEEVEERTYSVFDDAMVLRKMYELRQSPERMANAITWLQEKRQSYVEEINETNAVIAMFSEGR